MASSGERAKEKGAKKESKDAERKTGCSFASSRNGRCIFMPGDMRAERQTRHRVCVSKTAEKMCCANVIALNCPLPLQCLCF